MATPARRDWLHTFPPLRWKPRLGRRRHSSIHHAYHHPVEGMFIGIGMMFVGIALMYAWMLALTIWLIEIEIWCGVWGYYGLFLGLRWAINAVRTKRAQQPVPVDPYARPIDLGALAGQQPGADPWDTGQMRRRG